MYAADFSVAIIAKQTFTQESGYFAYEKAIYLFSFVNSLISIKKIPVIVHYGSIFVFWRVFQG